MGKYLMALYEKTLRDAFSGRTVFITGSDGFVRSHLTERMSLGATCFFEAASR